MKRRFFPCQKCYDLGNTCQECKDRNKKLFSGRELTEKTKELIKEGKQKILK